MTITTGLGSRRRTAAAATASMRIEVLRPGELSDGHVAQWRAMKSASPSFANPFLSPEFALAVGRVRPSARVAVLHRDEEVVAFFAFERGRFGLGRAIGAGVSDCQGLVHRAGFQCDPIELLGACRLAVWEFDHLADDQASFAGSRSRCAPSPVIDVSRGFDAYLEQLAARSKIARSVFAKERKMGRQVGEVRFEFDSSSDEALSALMAWKSAQYRRTGHRDRFAQAWIVELVRDLHSTRSDTFAGTLSVLWAGDEPAAVHMGIRSETVMSLWFSGYDRRFSKYSPGLILRLRMAEAAAAVGIHHLDMGKGYGEYKEQLKSADLVVGEGRVRRPTPVGLIHHLRRAPRERAERFVLDHPTLRMAARRGLQHAGALRARWSPGER